MRDPKPAPEPGQLVTVRNRPAIVTGTKPHRTPQGSTTIVNVDYLDRSEHPASDQLLWEVEPRANRMENAGWPNIHQDAPDDPDLYDAYEDSVRWTSLQSIQSILGSEDDLPLVSPWSAAIQIEDYQLTPLLQALSMPRVSLLLADDVGLGKTIQAGLIATELILRRHLKRILIVCPASLQVQWQEEMSEKFHLDFEIMDADEVRRTQRELGSDINPWSVHNRIITSMDYLRQEYVYQGFEQSAQKRQEETGGAFAPWDLLVVDEAHNFSPKSLTDESLRTRMMRRLTQWFEHKIFLTATPHNGYTHSFLGLLELLDPYRFVQRSEMTDTDRRQVDSVMVRRLKREINQVSSVKRFGDREVIGVPVPLSSEGRSLYDALRAYRDRAHERLTDEKDKNRGRFIFSLLSKRLLSSPYAFARTWWRHVGAEGFVDEDELDRSLRKVEEDVADDIEKDDRERKALADAGSWLLREHRDLKDPAETVSQALEAYGWDAETTLKGPEPGLAFEDAKMDALLKHLEEGFPSNDLAPLVGPAEDPSSERLILFTEYKDTLEYIKRHLADAGYDHPVVREIYGGMSRTERDEIKQAFNDPRSPVRILVATDAASEGLNLQKMCRYVAHYEIPWNPMRLEQRNGRVDRHGQSRDVKIFHYASDDDADQQFLGRIIEKVNEARDDLGSVGTVIDEGVHQHFWGELDQDTLSGWVDQAREEDPVKEDLQEVSPPDAEQFDEARSRFQEASEAYDLKVDTIRNVVEHHLNLQGANLEDAGEGHRITNARGRLRRFLTENLADESDALPRLVFDPDAYIEDAGGRRLYKPKPGTRLIRLGDPLTQQALSTFRRALWGQEAKINRWTLLGHRSSIDHEAYVQLQYLLTARNKLQEVVESHMGSWWFHATQDGLQHIEDPPSLGETKRVDQETRDAWVKRLRPAFYDLDDITEDLETGLKQRTRESLVDRLSKAQEQARVDFEERFEERMEELKRDMGKQRRKRLQEELIRAEEKAEQITFSEEENVKRQRNLRQLRERLSDDDLRVWDENMKQLKQRLEREQQRYLDHVLPKRYELSEHVEIVEVGARIIVPSGGAT